MSKTIKNYLENLQLEQFFKRLGARNPKLLAQEVAHFTSKEAEKRDKIVTSYFGTDEINRVVTTVAELLLARPKLPSDAKVLDLGVGSGFFTVKIAKKIWGKLPTVSFYAMDLTPAMLLSLMKKKARITPFIGIAENIEGSIKEAKKHFPVPLKFDAVFSTLMLHHSLQPEKVFSSIRKILKKNGKAILLDLCEHSFEEFKTEMGDVHLGFKPESIRKMARKHFSNVRVEKLPGIRCECSRRAAEIFVVSMQNNAQV
jgi:SAM-dependent methyltransferase